MNQEDIRNTYAPQYYTAAVSVLQRTRLLPSIGAILATQCLLLCRTVLLVDPAGMSVLVHGNQAHDA
jgi:hypothetical protein